jgi:hypothetical protein
MMGFVCIAAIMQSRLQSSFQYRSSSSLCLMIDSHEPIPRSSAITAISRRRLARCAFIDFDFRLPIVDSCKAGSIY